MFLWVKNPIKLLSRLLRKDHDIRRQKVENNWKKTFRQDLNAFSHPHLHLSFLNIKCHFLANRHLKLNCNVMLWRISYLPIWLEPFWIFQGKCITKTLISWDISPPHTHLDVKAAGLVGVWPPAHPAVAAAELVHHELVILTPGAHPATLLTLAHFLQSWW